MRSSIWSRAFLLISEASLCCWHVFELVSFWSLCGIFCFLCLCFAVWIDGFQLDFNVRVCADDLCMLVKAAGFDENDPSAQGDLELMPTNESRTALAKGIVWSGNVWECCDTIFLLACRGALLGCFLLILHLCMFSWRVCTGWRSGWELAVARTVWI